MALSNEVNDIVGVGFGPANLALAIALREQSEISGGSSSYLFFERKNRFGWHRGMLIDGATMQISFLKDLATMRNPQSSFTFISYLHAQGRTAAFINSQTIYPLRQEFHNYLEWSASQFAEDEVIYDSEVIQVEPVSSGGSVEYLDVKVRAGTKVEVHRARNIVIGTGLTPWIPDGVTQSSTVWHSANLVDHASKIEQGRKFTALVVGSGQSAAESVEFLHRKFPNANIMSVHSRYGYSVADDSPFANEIFDAGAVDEFYSAPADVRSKLIDYHRNTNYSVVDIDLSKSIYSRMYEESVLGKPRIQILKMCSVREVIDREDRVEVCVDHLATGTSQKILADIVVYATGYRPHDPEKILKSLASECKRDETGQLSLSRNYRLQTSESVRSGIYVHGAYSERSHGLSSGLLSNIAIRAGEIAEEIKGDTEPRQTRR